MRCLCCHMKKNRFLMAVLALVAVIVVLALWVQILVWAEKHITPVYQDYQKEKTATKLLDVNIKTINQEGVEFNEG